MEKIITLLFKEKLLIIQLEIFFCRQLSNDFRFILLLVCFYNRSKVIPLIYNFERM